MRYEIYADDTFLALRYTLATATLAAADFGRLWKNVHIRKIDDGRTVGSRGPGDNPGR